MRYYYVKNVYNFEVYHIICTLLFILLHIASKYVQSQLAMRQKHCKLRIVPYSLYITYLIASPDSLRFKSRSTQKSVLLRVTYYPIVVSLIASSNCNADT